VEREGLLHGVEAVIDKDLATALLSSTLGASELVLVTGVCGAYTNFESDRARLIGRTDPDALQQLLDDGHFPPGTMGPKIEAAIAFVRAGGRRAVICRPADLAAAIAGEAGTIVEAQHV
jgi:carbamate kinase